MAWVSFMNDFQVIIEIKMIIFAAAWVWLVDGWFSGGNWLTLSGSILCWFPVSLGPAASLSGDRNDSRFAPSQWETALLCNNVSHWLGETASLSGDRDVSRLAPSQWETALLCNDVSHWLGEAASLSGDRDESRFAPSQWEMALLCNYISHWLGASPVGADSKYSAMAAVVLSPRKA